MLTLTVNGETFRSPAKSLADLLVELALPTLGIAVAVNGNVVRRADHATALLNEGDQIEIIRAVQGG